MKKLAVLLSMLFVGGQSAHTAGFQIPEMGVKAMGMAHAFTAVADEPTANWFNPAGLAFQEGGAITVGGVAVVPKVDFAANSSNSSPTATSSIVDKTLFVPHTYMSINTPEGLTAGIGINAPFGLEIEWPTDAVFADAAQYGRLQAVNVNPNVAFKLSDNFALAIGANYVNMYNVDFNGTALRQNFSGDGWGFNAALLYRSEQFNFGVSYRSDIKIQAKGTSTNAVASSSNSIPVTVPALLNIGVAFHPTEKWMVSMDADWVDWKKFDQLAFTYSPSLTGVGASLTVPENWKSTWAFRIGSEWEYSDTKRVRFGYTCDPTPIKDVDFTPLLPGNDRQALHIGYGVDLSDQATLDLAYMYMWLNDRNQTQSTGTNVVRNGTYSSDIHLAAASLTFRF